MSRKKRSPGWWWRISSLAWAHEVRDRVLEEHPNMNPVFIMNATEVLVASRGQYDPDEAAQDAIAFMKERYGPAPFLRLYDSDLRPNPKNVSWKTVEWLKLPTKLAWTAHWSYVVDQEYERLRGSGFTLYCIIPEGGDLGVYRESDYGTGIAYEHQTDLVEEELCLTSDGMRTYLQTLMRNAQTVVESGYAEYHEDDFGDAVDQYGLAYDIFRRLKFQLIGAPEVLEEA
jgi:hypothetical protein